MKVKVNDATLIQLNWMVAMAENWAGADFLVKPYCTDWSQGGPIIEQEKIDLFTEKQTYPESWCASVARHQNGKRLVGWRLHQYGPTPLVAAMRCYVASRLGDEVEIPEELT